MDKEVKKLSVIHANFAGCEGCNVSILRAYPKMENMVDLDISYLGERRKNEYDVALVTGGVCMNDQEGLEELKRIRKISRILVAFGSCASFGGILRFCRGGQEPRPDHRNFQPINSVVKVDYSIPGCPPTPQMIISFFRFLREGNERRLRVFGVISRIKKLSGFDLIDDVVLTGLCIGCGACELSCPTGAIRLIDRSPDLIQEKCIRCGTCYVRCPRASSIICMRGD